MENIEEKILQFDELSTEEQRAVEAYVEAHPEWQSLLEEVKMLNAVRNEIRLLRNIDDEALAYYVVAQRFDVVSESSLLQHVFDQVEERLAEDDALRARYEELARRLEEITASLDPIAQFEELSGFRLAEAHAGEAPSEQADRNATRERSFFDRLVPFVTLPHAARWAVAAVLLVAVLYGGLLAASRLAQSDVERLALVDLSETEIQGYELTTRGVQASADSLSTDVLYLRALRTIRDARTSFLGLFPHYNQRELAKAEELLEQVIEREPSRSFLQIEAYFFLGKVHLAQGEIEAARSNFQTVAICEGRRTSEAVKILTELQENYPAHGQSYIVG